jgi:hypothetical protein
MRLALSPLLFEEEKVVEEKREVRSIVTDSRRSKKARAALALPKTEAKFPVHSFRTLMEDLATITKNTIQANCSEVSLSFGKITQPTSLQQRALDLLSVSLICTQ